MERERRTTYWNRPYGWRAGERYVAPGASAIDVIQYETEELGNTLDIPDFLLTELVQKQVSAHDIVWVCETRDHARRYSGKGIGQPYKEDVDQDALILATDEEPETGYLVLTHASRLDPLVVERYVDYRRRQQGDRSSS